MRGEYFYSLLARPVCVAAGPGTTTRGTVVLRTVTTTSPATATTSLAFAAPEFSRETSQQEGQGRPGQGRREAERASLPMPRPAGFFSPPSPGLQRASVGSARLALPCLYAPAQGKPCTPTVY